METTDMIKVMQHYADGGEVENKEKESNKWFKAYTPAWNWSKYDYRIKKEKITIEKWLYNNIENEYAIFESSNPDRYTAWKKVKLLETYEVEI